MSYRVILFILLPSFVLNSAEMKSEVRKKRILYGHDAYKKQRNAYPIFRYYVYLAKAAPGEIKEKYSKWDKLLGRIQVASIEWLHCGGSLLTPNIVQTACHCLAVYNQNSNYDNYTYGWPVNVWEDRIYSYFGSNEVDKMYDMLIPKHYVIYQNCRMMRFGLDFAMMDFGFIVTKDSVDKKAPKAAVSYAPAYKAKDILEFYYKTISKEFMCLVVGHGDWLVRLHRDPDGLFAEVVSQPSDVQKWGWRTVLNYVDCLSASYPIRRRKKKKNRAFAFFNYTRDSTQVCLTAFTDVNKYHYNLGAGDSGGPISCNDVFFAVNCMSDDAGDNILSYASPIVHTTFENAAEYRDEFLRWSQGWDPYTDLQPDKPYVIPTYPDLNPTPPPYDLQPLSHCSHIMTIQHHLLILSSTFFVSVFSFCPIFV